MNLSAWVGHLFVPRDSNNYRARILHTEILLVLSFFVIFFQGSFNLLPFLGVRVLGYKAQIPVARVVELTNEKRLASGLNALEVNDVLTEAAREKGEHMLANDYWAHVAPDGTEPWSFFLDNGYKYRYAGENLARDFSDPNSTVEAWMASETHRENMLSPRYKEIGIAVVEGDLNGVDTTIVVQLFGTSASVAAASAAIPVAVAQDEISEVLTEAVTEEAAFVEEPEVAGGAMLSPFNVTRGLSLVFIVFLLGLLAVDVVVIERRQVSRPASRTFAHLAFFGMIAAIIIIARAGQIL